MAPRHSRPRRLLIPVVLAAVLATEVTGLAVARSIALVSPVASAVVTAKPGPRAGDSQLGRLSVARESTRGIAPARPRMIAVPPKVTRRHAPSRTGLRHGGPSVAVSARSVTAPRASAAATQNRSARAPRANTTATFRGRNHVWIPALHTSAAVQSFPCDRSRPPDAGVYRWGCAGRNNVYLLGHAWSTFRALHDAYVGHSLRAGMAVWYGDAVGHVHEYRVAWWRVVAPTTAASWAWAPQSRPSMTLQTCVGARSQYRLMVRLLEVR